MVPGAEICRTDAVALAEQIRLKQVSALEVTEAVLDRMNRVEPHVHTFCSPSPDLASPRPAESIHSWPQAKISDRSAAFEATRPWADRWPPLLAQLGL